MRQKIFSRRAGSLALIAWALIFALHDSHAQTDKPLRVIVPLASGSAVDTVARIIGPPLSRSLGQPVVIENLVGAGGVTGTGQLVRAPKDGQTIAIVSSNHVVNPSIYKSMPYDSLRDITPITVFGSIPLVLVVSNSLPAKNTRELLALARSRPGALNYGSSGIGSILHLAGELFKEESGTFITHIPYRGAAQAMTDIIGGQLDMGFVAVTVAAAQIKAGKVRAIGVSGKTRSALLPEVPTLAESGLPKYNFDGWLAVIGPAGLSKPVAENLYEKLKTAFAAPDVQQRLTAQGMTFMDVPPDRAGAFFLREFENHARLVKRSGLVTE